MPEVGLFSDGTAVRLVGKETFRLCQRYVDEVITVDSDALCAAIKDVFQETRSILEPAGALGVAGAKAYAAHTPLAGKTIVAAANEANMNFDRLRFVAERAEVGEKREALFAVTIPEERGSFKRLCGLVGEASSCKLPHRRQRGGARLRWCAARPRRRCPGARAVVRKGRLSHRRSDGG